MPTKPAADLVADYIVADAYDTGRRDGYLDLGNSRRYRALLRLRRDAVEALKAEGYPVRFDDYLDEVAELTRADLVAAFRRLARRRVAEAAGVHAAGPSIRNALRRAIADLDNRHDDEALHADLEDVLYNELGIDVRFERIARRTGAGTVVA